MVFDLSDRINRIQTSQTIKIADITRDLIAKGKKVISLSQGEPDFETPEHIKKAAINAIEDGKTKYSYVDGMPLLKEAVREKFLSENSLDYKISEISIGTGCKQIIFNALMSLLNPGDEVIIPSPFWVSYKDIVEFAEGIPVLVDCSIENRFKLTPDDLESAINKSTRCLIINNPTNPTGSVYSYDELKSISNVLVKYPNIFVISDDIYEYLVYNDSKFHTIAEIDENIKMRTLTCNGMSKSFCMTGWRLGYGGGPKKLIEAMSKLQSQSTFHPSTISQYAAIAGLNGSRDFITDQKKSYEERRNITVSYLNNIDGITCNTPEGSFYAFPSCKDLYGKRTPNGEILKNDIDVCAYILKEAEVSVSPGSFFGKKDYFRVCYTAEKNLLSEALNRISNAFTLIK
jgi:aspartate aminotransferase|tara:strand:+ start:3395 stop:4600 length:1206 start_codon:yes stop_codon:yes gene_type:complete